MPRQKKEKDKFSKLSPEFKERLNSITEEADYRAIISESAIRLAALETAKKNDQHLAELKEQVADIVSTYREAIKEHTLRILATIEAMRAAGIEVPDFPDILEEAKGE